MGAGDQDKKYKLCPAISGPKKTGRPELDKSRKSLMEQAMEKKKKHHTKEATKQASFKVTKVCEEKKRKADTKKRKADTETHAPHKKQVATYGTKRVSERQRKLKQDM